MNLFYIEKKSRNEFYFANIRNMQNKKGIYIVL